MQIMKTWTHFKVKRQTSSKNKNFFKQRVLHIDKYIESQREENIHCNFVLLSVNIFLLILINNFRKTLRIVQQFLLPFYPTRLKPWLIDSKIMVKQNQVGKGSICCKCINLSSYKYVSFRRLDVNYGDLGWKI